jgi:hypothetical protein
MAGQPNEMREGRIGFVFSGEPEGGRPRWRTNSQDLGSFLPHLRMAPVPLSTRFADCDEAIQRLKTSMNNLTFADFPFEREIIT